MPIDPFLAPPRLLEVSHVAHRLSVTQRYVWGLIAKGNLPAIRLGNRWRIDPDDLHAFIEAQRVQIAQQEQRVDALLASGSTRVDDLKARRERLADG